MIKKTQKEQPTKLLPKSVLKDFKKLYDLFSYEPPFDIKPTERT